MKRFNQIFAVTLSLLMLGPITPRAAAADQESLVSESQIGDALKRASADERAARDKIRSLLSREDVLRLAKDFGLDGRELDKAAAAVDTLEGKELEQAAAYAAELDDELAGGHTITISLVAFLLIIIIIILLAK